MNIVGYNNYHLMAIPAFDMSLTSLVTPLIDSEVHHGMTTPSVNNEHSPDKCKLKISMN